MARLKVFTAFSGYDSQMIALKNRLKLDCDLVGWSEIDKYAVQAHNELFPEYANRNFGDIKTINWNKVPDFDLFTYSSPCQDFSCAGEQKGGDKGSGTRSSLLWECERAIKAKKPKYLLFENVSNIVSSTFKPCFDAWCKKLEKLGYTNYWQVLNAIDYGVPQLRKRIYMISILGGGGYVFPAKFSKKVTLEDYVESNVDSKYYLKTEGIRSRIKSSLKRKKMGWGTSYKLITKSDTARCVLTKRDGSNDNYLISPMRNKKTGSIERYYRSDHFNTICTSQTSSTAQWLKYAGQIRRLTPTECFRLMGMKDNEIKKLISSGISDTQLYKLAGNSIVVDVLVAIFGQLFNKKRSKHSTLGSLAKIKEILESKNIKPIKKRVRL